MSNLTELTQALVELEEERVKSLVEERLQSGEEPLNLIKELNLGMVQIGKLFEDNQYFLSELIMSGEILKEVMNRLEPLLTGAKSQDAAGVVVIGTVQDDIHDIGKNIVATLLKGTGFEVIDLGVDVPPEKFVAAIKESGAKVLGLSALLNLTFPSLKKVVDALVEAGIRDDVKVVIGGAPCNEQVREYAGADYYAKDAAMGVKICQEIYN